MGLYVTYFSVAEVINLGMKTMHIFIWLNQTHLTEFFPFIVNLLVDNTFILVCANKVLSSLLSKQAECVRLYKFVGGLLGGEGTV